MKTVLAADIGATNARFALVERPAADARIVFERTYPTASEPALAAFLHEAGRRKIAGAAIAIAGPVDEGAGRLTNRTGWTVDRRTFERLGFEARLINDFQALAYGVAHAVPDDYIVLQQGKSAPQGPIALVGAGAGLGVASLVWDGRRYRPLPSEGGHAGFAPRDDTQAALWRHLRARHGRVSAERVLCGAGLAAIYEFISGSKNDPAEISSQALAEPASAAGKALALFIDCYGAFAGDVALTFLARGGVYVCGGIAAKLANRLAERDSLAAFNDKGRHRDLLATIPVRVVINEKLGLLGAGRAAA
jgi:glucokinase